MITIIKDNASVQELTPELVAALFCGLDDTEQALFFNAVAEAYKDSPLGLGMQLCAVSGNEALTNAGRNVMQEIGSESHYGIMRQVMKDVTGYPYASMYRGKGVES